MQSWYYAYLQFSLYTYEIRGMPETERLAARQSRSAPLPALLHEWMMEKEPRCRKKSRLEDAFTYALNQWGALRYYCDD